MKKYIILISFLFVFFIETSSANGYVLKIINRAPIKINCQYTSDASDNNQSTFIINANETSDPINLNASNFYNFSLICSPIANTGTNRIWPCTIKIRNLNEYSGQSKTMDCGIGAFGARNPFLKYNLYFYKNNMNNTLTAIFAEDVQRIKLLTRISPTQLNSFCYAPSAKFN